RGHPALTRRVVRLGTPVRARARTIGVPGSAEVFERLAAGEAGEIRVFVHKGPYPVRRGLRVLPQRPADPLAQEELGLGDRGFDGSREQVCVGRLPRPDLADDRTPPPPEIGVRGPG